MKIKTDFVTNSSSTSFIFAFKGNKRSYLFEKMVKYKEKFDLYNEYGSGSDRINVWDIIHAIDPILRTNKEDPWYLPGPIKLETYLANLKESLTMYENEYASAIKAEQDGNVPLLSPNYALESVSEYKDKIKRIKKIIKKGIDHYIEISFGDNDGMISGGRVGMTMDYSGRDIKIDEDDFVVFVENCH
jgi:predicted methyltransferase MtxX (methanogen marker protein 4)